MTKILLRYDDYSAISNTDIERQLFEAVAKRGMNLIVAVVPFVAGIEWQLRGPIPLHPLPPDKIALFKEFSAYLEPVLHGYAHQTVSRYSGLSEFNHAIPASQQVARLQDAKSYLEDVAAIKVLVVFEAAELFKHGHAVFFSAAGVHGGFVYDDVAAFKHFAHGFAGFDEGREVGFP